MLGDEGAKFNAVVAPDGAARNSGCDRDADRRRVSEPVSDAGSPGPKPSA